jgi:hypothetical protein
VKSIVGEQSEEYYGRTLKGMVSTLYREILTDLPLCFVVFEAQ